MPKSFIDSINPIARKTSLFSPLPGAFFKQNSPDSFHEIEDNLVWDDKSPLHRVRFDSSLSLWQRCIEMYKAIMGAHYIEKLYPSHKEKQSTTTAASIFSDFCQEDWIFYFIPESGSLENAEMLLYLGKYLSIKTNEYKSYDKLELEDNTIYIQINEDKKFYYTLKSLNGRLFPIEIDISTPPSSTQEWNKVFIPHIINAIKTNGHLQNKKVIQLHNYIKTENTIDCRLLSADNQIITYKIELDKLNDMIENESSVLSPQKFSYKNTLKLDLYFRNWSQQLSQSGVGALSSSLNNLLHGIPQIEPVQDTIFKKCILGYLVKSGAIQQVDHYVIDGEHAKGQKGLLDYLVFPLVARKIVYDTVYYKNKKIEIFFDYPIKFILFTPLVHVLTLINLLLEMLRKLSGILLALICAVTVVPALHYQLKSTKNETMQMSNDTSVYTENTKCSC